MPYAKMENPLVGNPATWGDQELYSVVPPPDPITGQQSVSYATYQEIQDHIAENEKYYEEFVGRGPKDADGFGTITPDDVIAMAEAEIKSATIQGRLLTNEDGSLEVYPENRTDEQWEKFNANLQNREEASADDTGDTGVYEEDTGEEQEAYTPPKEKDPRGWMRESAARQYGGEIPTHAGAHDDPGAFKQEQGTLSGLQRVAAHLKSPTAYSAVQPPTTQQYLKELTSKAASNAMKPEKKHQEEEEGGRL